MKKAMLSLLPTVEHLEARIAPATLTFVDVDGDQVTITTSKGSDADLAAIVHFESGTAGQLQEIDLASNPVFKGTNLSITAEGAGDGVVNVGFINATGIDLGQVLVDGDVGQIDAGDSKVTTPGIKKLEVGSLGALGTTTQNSADASLVSLITGPLPSFISHGDVKGTLEVTGGSKRAAGRIDNIEIDGSLVGGDLARSGSIIASGAIGDVVIHQNLQGGAQEKTGYIEGSSLKTLVIEKSIIGGSGVFSGAIKIRGNINQVQVTENVTGGVGIADHTGEIRADGEIKNVLIIGQLKGGGGLNSGSIGSGKGLGTVKIDGGILGGTGTESGTVGTKGSIDKVTVSGGVTGGDGLRSGSILAGARIADVTINGDVSGDDGDNSGVIATDGGLVKVVVNGSVKGGIGEESGAIGSRKPLLSVLITGNLEGGGGDQSGAVVSSTSIRNVTVNGNVTGGAGARSGAIGAFGQIDFVKIGGNLEGGGNFNAGAILSQSSIVKIEIDGGIQGGAGFESGVIKSLGTIGAVDVQLDVTGGSNIFAGGIYAERSIQNVAIHGSLVGGTNSNTGLILTPGVIAKVTIDNDLRGGTSDFTGAIQGFRVENVLIGDEIIGSEGFRSAVIVASADAPGVPSERAELRLKAVTTQPVLGTIKILGDVEGGSGPESGSLISDGRIISVTIGREGSPEGQFLVPRALPPSGIGSLIGGQGSRSGSIYADGEIGSILIYEDLVGGTGDVGSNSGRIFSGGNIQKLTILGNLRGGSSSYGTSSEGGPEEPGQVYARGRIGTVAIGDSVVGGSGNYSGAIRAGAIASITVGNNVIAGPGNYSASFVSEVQDIGAVTIQGAISTFTGIFDGEGFVPAGINAASIGAARNLGKVDIGSIEGLQDSHVLITAGGQLAARTDKEARAIGSIVVRGSSNYADILAGYGIDFFRTPINADAQIGTVMIGSPELGSSAAWFNTNLVAGSIAGPDGQFGTDDDAIIDNPEASSKTISKIASVIIRGGVQGNGGIVAEQVVAVTVSGQKIALKTGPRNDLLSVPFGESTLNINEPTSTFVPPPEV